MAEPNSCGRVPRGGPIRIHKELGPGLLESVYEAVLARALTRCGLRVERQKTFTFECDGMLFEEGLRIDLLAESCVVVELKSLEKQAQVHAKKTLTYIRLMKLQVGLLINFGGETLKEGERSMKCVLWCLLGLWGFVPPLT